MSPRMFATIGAGALLIMASVPALATRPARAGSANADPVWARWDPSTKTASLTITAAYNQVGSGFNFDGYNNGGLTITVPTGAKVVVSYTNRAAVSHSVVITPFAKHSLVGNFPLAFPGSASPNAGVGVTKLKVPQVFSFTAGKAGTYAIVCGVPGHAVGGMWDTLKVVDGAGTVSQQGSGSGSTAAPVMTMPIAGGGSMGAVEGTVTDATSGKPIAHAYMVLGWTTLKRVGETDAKGHYRIDNVPPTGLVDAYGFAENYVYYHGHPIPVKAGQVTEYTFKMPRQTFPKDLLPTLTGATISKTIAKAGETVTFQAHIAPGKGGPMSAEDFAVNGPLGHEVLLSRVGSTTYRGTWQIPAGTKPGSYEFVFFGAMENCLENMPYQRVSLMVG